MRYNENNKRDIEKTRVHCAFCPPSIDDRHKMLWRHGNKTGKWTVEHINVIIAHIVVYSALQFDAVAVCCNLAAHFSNSPFGYVYGAAPSAPPSSIRPVVVANSSISYVALYRHSIYATHARTTKEFNYHFICVYLLGNKNKESESDYNSIASYNADADTYILVLYIYTLLPGN